MWWHNGDAREGKCRGNWRMAWVASTLHTTSEHGVSSITTADAAHLGCQQSTELTPTGRFKWTRPFGQKTKSGFCACAITFQTQSTRSFQASETEPLAREGKWRGNWRMQCVVSTLHTTSEHGVSNITTADAHTSTVSSRLNWRPPADLNGLENAVGSQYPSHYLGTWCIQHYYRWCAHLGCQ